MIFLCFWFIRRDTVVCLHENNIPSVHIVLNVIGLMYTGNALKFLLPFFFVYNKFKVSVVAAMAVWHSIDDKKTTMLICILHELPFFTRFMRSFCDSILFFSSVDSQT